jgi:hypothetical protein
MAVALHGRRLHPLVVRALLSDSECGTPSSGSDKIGSMPDLRAVVERLETIDARHMI